MDPKNIRAIEDLPTPTSVTDIGSFLGLARYYRNFIENFSKISYPMTTLQKKANNFLWTTKWEEIFQNLKQLLMTTPILRNTDIDGDFIVCKDACKEGLGGVLLQNDQAICYESQKLKDHDQNYSTHDLELGTIIHALKIWRHYLMGRMFF